MNVALIATIFSFLRFIESSSVNQVNTISPDAEKTRQERGHNRRGCWGGGV